MKRRRRSGQSPKRVGLLLQRNTERRADALFTSRPEIKNGRIENTGDVWVIMNSTREELEDFFREGVELWDDELSLLTIKDDPKPVICLGMKGNATLILGEAKESADYLLSRIITASYQGI